MAQFGRALRSGRRGRRFKSCRIDSWQGRRSIWRNSDVPVFLLKRKKLRSGRRGVHKIRWILVLNRPKQSVEPQGPVDLGFGPTEAEAETAGSNPVASTLGRGAGAFEEIQVFRFFVVF